MSSGPSHLLQEPLQVGTVGYLSSNMLTLLESLGVGVVYLLETGRVAYCNVAARRTLGWTKQAVMGHPIASLPLMGLEELALEEAARLQHNTLQHTVQLSGGFLTEVVLYPIRHGPPPHRGLILWLRSISENQKLQAGAHNC